MDSSGQGQLEITQDETRRYAFEERGTGPWTILYRSWRKETSNGAEFAAFAPVSYRSRALDSASWDWSIGDGAPGFTQYFDDGKPKTVYQRFGGITDDVEPIVLTQNHFGIKARMLPQLGEEFRLFHNLWIDPTGNRLVKVQMDGSEECVAEIDDDLVRVRTRYLRQFQAARQVDLLLFIDSVVFVPHLELDEADRERLSGEIVGADYRYVINVGEPFDKRSGPFSRLLGKRVLAPPPEEKSGVWPYDEREEAYPEFVIGEDDVGDPILNTCDPDLLANYFGANPDAPHYLTPVFFRREVLQRYYEDPDRYSVEDGYLRCGGLWGLRLDNDHPNHVMVFLGDLGRDLPESERGYWRTFNISPTGTMSPTVFRRSFMGQPADPEAPDLTFKSAYARFSEGWTKARGWDFFKPLHDADRHVLARLRVPLNETQPEFEDQILGLAKLLVDALNERRFVEEVGRGPDDEKGISKLERWLSANAYPQVDRDIAFLRRLQSLRSKIAAHRKSSDYQSMLKTQSVDENLIREVVLQLVDARRMLDDLAQHFNIKF